MSGETPVQHNPNTDAARIVRATNLATGLILSSITTYPRRPLSSRLVAQRLLANCRAKTRGPILPDLAVMQPDPADMARKINRIHEHWGIQYRLTEPEALHVVCLNGILAAEEIRSQTARIAPRHGLALPNTVTSRFQAPVDGATPEHLPTTEAHVLHGYLAEHPALLDDVTTAIDVKAAAVRACSAAQQQAALAEGARKVSALAVAAE